VALENKIMVNSLLFLITSVHLVTGAPASTPTIGAGRSPGSFNLDGSAIRGNSTIFEGSTIESAASRVVIQLHSTEVTLSPQSRVTVFRDHSVLQSGALLLKDSGAYLVDAAGLRINSRGNSYVQVQINGPSQVLVGARRGMAEVHSAAGVQVATLHAGMALNLTPQAAETESNMSVTGCVERQGERYLVTDETSQVTVELQGPDVASYAGRRVAITGSRLTGTPNLAGVAHTVRVITAEPDAGRACKAVGGGAVPASKAVGGHGVITPGRAAVIAGVAVSAAMLGAVATGSLDCHCPISPQ
jgi:hypothetical protein